MSFKKAEREAWAQLRSFERLALRLYGGISSLIPSNLAIAILRHRAKRHPQREEASRVPERMALNLPQRPEGPLIWLNAIGPGDASALLPLIRVFLEEDSNAACVATTRTASGQRVFARLGQSSRVIPQLAPLDTPSAIRRFLDHWRPSLAVFNEGDIWPNTLQELKGRNIPTALVNAQMNWRLGKAVKKYPRLARWMLSHIDYAHIFPEEAALEARPWFRDDCKVVGRPNLKMEAPPLLHSRDTVNAVREAWGESPILTCASIANSEVGVLLEAAELLRAKLPDFRMILVPRWIEQRNAIAGIAANTGTPFSCRSSEKFPRKDDKIFVADSYGEMGSWIDLSFAVFMGHTLNGSLGHNPFEPIAQRRIIVSGSIPRFLYADYRYLHDLGLCRIAADAASIASVALEILRKEASSADQFEEFERDRGFSKEVAVGLYDAGKNHYGEKVSM